MGVAWFSSLVLRPPLSEVVVALHGLWMFCFVLFFIVCS